MQKTAYEMRISDWSSDVCSSDLSPENAANSALLISPAHAFTIQVLRHEFPIDRILQYGLDIIGTSVAAIDVIGMLPDRKTVVAGKRVYVRLDLGGPGLFTKLTYTNYNYKNMTNKIL